MNPALPTHLNAEHHVPLHRSHFLSRISHHPCFGASFKISRGVQSVEFIVGSLTFYFECLINAYHIVPPSLRRFSSARAGLQLVTGITCLYLFSLRSWQDDWILDHLNSRNTYVCETCTDEIVKGSAALLAT